MKENKPDRFVNRLYSLATIVILSGVIFKVQHYPYGSILIYAGFLLGVIASYFQISVLKKTIKKLEEKKSEE